MAGSLSLRARWNGNGNARRLARMLPFGGVDVPLNRQKVTGKVDVSGWALSEAGVESVAIHVDRTFAADCATGLARPDIGKMYAVMPGGSASGWTVTLDSGRFAPGWHELTVQARSKGGAARDLGSLRILIER
jgi:hypothetical protein